MKRTIKNRYQVERAVYGKDLDTKALEEYHNRMAQRRKEENEEKIILKDIQTCLDEKAEEWYKCKFSALDEFGKEEVLARVEMYFKEDEAYMAVIEKQYRNWR